MANTLYVGGKAYNRTLGCEVTILSLERPDGTVHIDTPYGKVYCFIGDLEVIKHGNKDA